MMMKKIIFMILLSFKTFAYMNVAPIVFDKRIDNGGATQEFYITNPTHNEVGYRIYKEKSEGLDMSNYMEVYPRALKLKSGETGVVKVYIESPKNIEKGEYTAILGIKEINIPESLKAGNSGLTIYTDLKLELAGFVGDISPTVEINNLNTKNNKISFEIKNSGEIRTKVEVFINSEDLKEDIYLDSFRLLKGASNTFEKELTSDIGSLKNPKLIILDTAGEKLMERGIWRE